METVKFSPRERCIVEMMCLGSAPKLIAFELEISHSAVNANIARACLKAGVTRSELVPFAHQHPEALERDGRFSPGLHVPGCLCDAPFCEGHRRLAA